MKVETASEHFFFMTLRIETERSVGTGFIFEHKWKCHRTGCRVDWYVLGHEQTRHCRCERREISLYAEYSRRFCAEVGKVG